MILAGHHGPELTAVVVLCLALGVGALTRWIAKKTRVPYTVAMMLLGIGAGIALQEWGEHIHLLHSLRDGSIVSSDLIVFVFLPALVFESAFALDVHAFRKDLGFVLLLAGPALLVATAATAALMMGVTSLEVCGSWNWSWSAALVFGTLVSATDPVAVVAVLREVGAPKRLGLLIEGESLLNDGTAIVVFHVLLGLLISGGAFDLGHSTLELLRVAGGGVLVGLLLGALTAAWLGRTFDDPLVEATLTVALAYAAMVVAEGVLHVSGVLALVVSGLYLAGPGRTRISPPVAHFLHELWEMVAYVANTVIFFLVGFVIAANLHLARWSTIVVILLCFGGLVVIRALLIFGFRPLGNRLGKTMSERPVDTRMALVMAWGGLRGAVSLALALVISREEALDEALRAQVLSVTAGVVLLTILVSGSTTGALLKKLGLIRVGPAEALAEARGRERVLQKLRERVDDADADPALATIPWGGVRRDIDGRRLQAIAEVEAATEAYEAADDGERLAALWRRAITVERRTLRHDHADGTLSAAALQRLERELDNHLDRVELGDLDPPESRLDARGFADALEALGRRLGFAFGRYAMHRQAIRYDLARTIVHACEKVRAMLAEVHADDPERADVVDAAYARYQAEAQQRFDDMRTYLPEVALAIEKRLARRMALGFERAAIRKVRGEGVMSDEAAARSDARVKAKLKALHFSPTRATLPETAELCRETALFADLDDETIAELAELTVEQTFAPGETIFAEGDRGDSMYVVARGTVEISRGGHVLAQLGHGQILGEMALLHGEPRNASAMAVTAVLVGRIARRPFERLLETRPEVEERVWARMGRRVLDNWLRARDEADDVRRWRVRKASVSVLEGVWTVPPGGALVLSGEVGHDGEAFGGGSWLRPGWMVNAAEPCRVIALPGTLEVNDDEDV